MADAANLLHRHDLRLATLIGAGGTGKMYLAQALAVDATNAPSVAAICRCLDGLPQAAKQAAADFLVIQPLSDD